MILKFCEFEALIVSSVDVFHFRCECMSLHNSSFVLAHIRTHWKILEIVNE